MAFAYADRVQETSTTTGTGTYNLAGAVTGFRGFVAGIGTTNTCHYCATDGTDWEVGVGTVTDAATDTLARTTILASSNSNNAVNWGAGTKNIFCTIAAAKLAPNVQTMTSTGSGDSWEKPNGGYSMCMVELWAGGGSGGKTRAGSAGGGGGGGQYVRKFFKLSDLSATEQVTVGAGGAGQTTADSNGNVGGNTTFGSGGTLVTAYGGGPGMGTNTGGINGGGHGGGPNAAGGTQTLVLHSTYSVDNFLNAAGVDGAGGRGNGAGALSGEAGASTAFNGAGGGGASTSPHLTAGGVGGSSVYGGAGGGSGASDVAPGPQAGGTSQFGGNGGAGAYDANAATAGSQPGGGGGGSETGTSGAGGDGKAIITCW